MSTVESRRAGNGYVGRSLKRKEDPRLITGRATYVDDIVAAGHALRRVRALARGAREDRLDRHLRAPRRARRRAVYTGEDIRRLGAPLPMAWVPPGVEVHTPEHWPLARGAVKHVGDPVAVVVGDDKYASSTPPRTWSSTTTRCPSSSTRRRRSRTARRSSASSSAPTRRHEWALGGGDVEAAFAEADVVVERRIVNHRTPGAPIEPRGVRGRVPRGRADALDSATQIPHLVRFVPGRRCWASPRSSVRVIAPEVGGGFGAKLQHYGEEALACALRAGKLGRPGASGSRRARST